VTGPAVVIPTHARRDLLRAAVASCVDLPVVVVDDSPNGMGPLHGVTWLRTSGSTGFARAVNHGLDHLAQRGTRAALVLNDDATLQAGCAQRLWQVWTTRGGVVGPVVRRPDGTVQSAGFRLADWGRMKARDSVPQGISSVDAVSGACLLMGTSWRFDPAYSHGMEDIELCRRVRRAGGSVVLVPDATCVHVGGATVATTSPEAQRKAVAGHLRLVGGGWRSGVVVGLALAQVVREAGGVTRARAVVQGWRDWRRG